MGRGKIFCSLCHQNFTRKWNAYRHNNTLHGNQADIVTEQGFPYLAARNQKKSSTFVNESHEDRRETMLHDALEGISNEIEETERLLSDSPEQERVNLIGESIFDAIRSTDPKKRIRDRLRSIRRSKTAAKTIHYVALALNIHPFQAEEKLKRSLELKARR